MLKKLSAISLSSAILFTGVSTIYENNQASAATDEDEGVTYLPMEESTLPDDPLLSDSEEASKTKIIHTGHYIKRQGYMTNKELKAYVKYVDANVGRLGWANTISGATSLNWAIATGTAVITQFIGNKANFDVVKNKAAQGYGMGWCHSYSTGKVSLSVIPRRDFSKSKIVYQK